MSAELSTSVPEADLTILKELDGWLREDRYVAAYVEEAEFNDDAPPAWYSQLLTSLALHVSGDSIDAVFPELDSDKEEVRTIVLTAKRIVDARVSLVERDLPSAAAISRTRVRAVRARATLGAHTRRSEWPGQISVDVDLEGAEQTLSLPLRPGPTRADMRQVLAGLLDDLG